MKLEANLQPGALMKILLNETDQYLSEMILTWNEPHKMIQENNHKDISQH